MSITTTKTATYTVADIRKTFEGFEADLRMIARRTGKWSIEHASDIAYDIIKCAENKYLREVSIILVNAEEKPLRAAKFKVNADGSAITSDRAGANDWEDIPNTSLKVVLGYSTNWQNLSEVQQNKFQLENGFKIKWGPSTINTAFSHLSKTQGQLYASNGFELQKEVYK